MFNDQLKAGDVCLITGAAYFPVNIGKTVKLLSLVNANEEYSTPDGNVWLFNPSNKSVTVVWSVEGQDLTDSKGSKQKYILCLPEFLMKIDGFKEPEANSEKLIQKA